MYDGCFPRKDDYASGSKGNQDRRRDNGKNDVLEFLGEVKVASAALHSRSERVVVEADRGAHARRGLLQLSRLECPWSLHHTCTGLPYVGNSYLVKCKGKMPLFEHDLCVRNAVR